MGVTSGQERCDPLWLANEKQWVESVRESVDALQPVEMLLASVDVSEIFRKREPALINDKWIRALSMKP